MLSGIVLFLALPVRSFLGWVTSHFVVTGDRVIHRSGWLAKRSMEIPLERINDVRFEQSVLERVVGAGDLRIESGGEFGQNNFSHIRRPEAVQKLIFEQAERNQRRALEGIRSRRTDRDPVDERVAVGRDRAAGLHEETGADHRGGVRDAEAPASRPPVVADQEFVRRRTTEVALGDGTRIRLRPITPDDKSRLIDGFRRLSPESRPDLEQRA